MVNDNLADFLIRIKNGYLSRQKEIPALYSRVCENLAKILVAEGYLDSYQIKEEDKKKSLLLVLKYSKKKPVLTDLKKISKPGLRVYAGKKKIFRVLGGLGMAIISTSKGLMTDKQAKEQGLGGEIICKIW